MAEIRKEIEPLVIWHRDWHYGKQDEFVTATGENWEIMFLSGNGGGKTHILDWSIACLAEGIHPFQFALPPLGIKMLVTDFEHGYGKIFRETCLQKQYMPPRFEIWDAENEKYLKYFCELHRSEEYIKTLEGSNFEIKEVPETVLGPMLHKNLIKKLPSRDDRTLELHNGSYIAFQTSEQKKRLHSGTNFDILACDEEPTYQTYDESVRGLRTAKGGGRIFHAFTPPFDEEDKQKGPTWTKEKLVDPIEKGEYKDGYLVRSSMMENPSITDAFVKKFARGKTEEQLRIQLYGDYPKSGELIFPEFEDFLWDPRQKMGHLLPYDFEIPFDEGDILWEFALDWHRSKPPAIVWSFEYKSGPNQGDVIFWAELSPQEGKGLTVSETKRAIHEKEGWQFISGRKRIRRYGDPKMKDKQNELISGYSAWKEFCHPPEPVRLTEGWNRNPGSGYSVVRDFLKGGSRGYIDHPRMFVVETCKTIRHNMKNHYWFKGDPDPKYNDYCVGVKYIMQNKARKAKKHLDSPYEQRWPLTGLNERYRYGYEVPR